MHDVRWTSLLIIVIIGEVLHLADYLSAIGMLGTPTDPSAPTDYGQVAGWCLPALLCVGFLLFTKVGTDVAVIGSLVLLMAFGVVSTDSAVLGFVKDGPLMIGGLFVVAAGMRETGAIERLAKVLLGRPLSLVTRPFSPMESPL